MRIPALAAVLLCTAVSIAQTTTQPVADRLKAQNAVFDDYWQTSLKLSPTRATGVGDYRYNDQLGDFSLASIESRHKIDLGYLARIKGISADGFSEEDRTSHDLFMRNLQENADGWDLKEYEMPIAAGNGPHTQLADLPNAVPLDTVKHYEDYIARLHQIPRVLLQSEEVLRAGMKDHLMPVKFVAEKVPDQVDGIVKADPFLYPIKRMPATFSDADKKRLTDAITNTVQQDVLPAYKQYKAFIVSDYIPAGRTTLSIESLPDGKRRYQALILRFTTTDLSPTVIHNIGLKEVDRITGEMTVLAKANGYPTLEAFRAKIETDPKYTPTSKQQIIDDFAKYIAQMRPKLPLLFTVIPPAPVTVEGIPDFQANESTHYQGGTPDGKRPGRVSVAVADPTHRSLLNDEAVAYHEGIPGHHMQISVAQTIPGLPEFRKHGGNSGYIEGWALYAEGLGKEVGFYQDPGSDYGRLRSELFRAVRLVVDTGIHDQGWTREMVVDYMRKSHAIDEPTIQSETDRYISGPAQALSYKLGQLKIRELRAKAQDQLGPHFDVRTFHDEVLSGGALPLGILDARVTRWINAQMPANAAK